MTPKHHVPFEKNTKCCAPTCTRMAEFEVFLYDVYRHNNEEFYEQDYTCPFLCEEHMRQNEVLAVGNRVPRGYVRYPYSNQHGAQGYTKYSALDEAYRELFSTKSLVTAPEVASAFLEVNDELLRYLAKHPELLREVQPRKFEEIVAALLENQGFEVELTKQTRDGGVDIFAAQNTALGSHLYVIECKRYASHQKVGVELVQRLHGVALAKRATMGILATTSTFSKDAIDFASPLRYSLSLRDFNAMKDWLAGLKKSPSSRSQS